jgi:hypothetical protein
MLCRPAGVGDALLFIFSTDGLERCTSSLSFSQHSRPIIWLSVKSGRIVILTTHPARARTPSPIDEFPIHVTLQPIDFWRQVLLPDCDLKMYVIHAFTDFSSNQKTPSTAPLRRRTALPPRMTRTNHSIHPAENTYTLSTIQ